MKRADPQHLIDSVQNPWVKQARAVERDRAERERERAYIAWGLHLAAEALATRAPIRRVFLGPNVDRSREGREIVHGLIKSGAPMMRTSTRVLDAIVDGSGDQGIVLLCSRPEPVAAGHLVANATLVLATHGVQDPGNLGSIVRTALALGAGGLIILPGCADPFGSRAARAAMGAQFSLPVSLAEIGEIVAIAGADRPAIVAADPEGGETPAQVDLSQPTLLLLGGEGAGLPADLLRAARHRVRIPTVSAVESLNVHAAAAALLYEAARQRGFRYESAREPPGSRPRSRPGA